MMVRAPARSSDHPKKNFPTPLPRITERPAHQRQDECSELASTEEGIFLSERVGRIDESLRARWRLAEESHLA